MNTRTLVLSLAVVAVLGGAWWEYTQKASERKMVEEISRVGNELRSVMAQSTEASRAGDQARVRELEEKRVSLEREYSEIVSRLGAGGDQRQVSTCLPEELVPKTPLADTQAGQRGTVNQVAMGKDCAKAVSK